MHLLARNQAGLAGGINPDVVALLLGDVSGHQHGIFLENPANGSSVVDVVADHDHALIETAGEGRTQSGARNVDFHSCHGSPCRFQVGLRRGELALGLEVLSGQFLRRLELDLPLLGESEGFAPARGEIARIDLHHHVAFGDPGAAFGSNLDDAPVDSRAQGERTGRLGTPIEDDGAAHRPGLELRHPHLEVSLALQCRFLVGPAAASTSCPRGRPTIPTRSPPPRSRGRP